MAKQVLSFTGGVAGNWDYSVMHLESVGRIQLWYNVPEWPGGWEIGHSKPIPEGMALYDAADVMRAYISREISYEEYNRLLPE